MNKDETINGLPNRQYILNNDDKKIEFNFKQTIVKIDLSTPDNRKFTIAGQDYYLLVDYRGRNKVPKFYVSGENDLYKKLKEGIVKGGWEYLGSAYYAVRITQ